jgi:GNAT superfamily N-acetyltransferase
VKLGYIQFAFTGQFPYGVTYGKWKNKYCWVDNVYVHPGNCRGNKRLTLEEHRGKGISKLLYKFLEKHCLENNVKEIMLDVYVVNQSSKIVHEKLGFVPLTIVYSKNVE